MNALRLLVSLVAILQLHLSEAAPIGKGRGNKGALQANKNGKSGHSQQAAAEGASVWFILLLEAW